MTELYQRMRETLLSSMGDTLVVNHQFKEAVTLIGKLEAENKRLRTVLENTVKHPETMISDEKIKTEILPNIKHRNDCWVLDVTPKAHPATTPACLCYEHALIRAGMEMTKKNGKSRNCDE